MTLNESGFEYKSTRRGYSTLPAIKTALQSKDIPYLGNIAGPFLSPEGVLISMEWMEYPEKLAAFISGMSHAGLSADLGACTQIPVEPGLKTTERVVPVIVFRKGNQAPSDKQFLGWWQRTYPAVATHSDLRDELVIRNASGRRMVHGWELQVEDQKGSGFIRVVVLEDSAGNAYWYETTSRGLRTLKEQGGPGSAKELVKRAQACVRGWQRPPTTVKRVRKLGQKDDY
jgi:hypothetical protein